MPWSQKEKNRQVWNTRTEIQLSMVSQMSNQTLGRLFNIAYIKCQALPVGTQPKNLLPQNWEGNKSVVEREIKSGKPLSYKSESKGFISPSTSIVTSAGNSLRAPRTWGAAEEPTWPICLLLAPCTFHYTRNINISSLFLDIIQTFSVWTYLHLYMTQQDDIEDWNPNPQVQKLVTALPSRVGFCNADWILPNFWCVA